MAETTYVTEFVVEPKPEFPVDVEIHLCPCCHGVFGIDTSFVDQVTVKIECMMCDNTIEIADPPED